MTVGKVLVVEDDDSLRRVTQMHLEKFGFATTTTTNAEQALRSLEQAPSDVVLTDLHLPGMSGLDLLKRIKLDYPETVVIVVTAFGTVSSAVEAMKAGAHDYITKPLHHYELNEMVRRAI